MKALFADAAFRERLEPRRRELDQLGADHGPGGLLRDRGAGAGRARAAGRASPCRPATSATSMPAIVAHRMGLPIERLIVATNRNDILARFFQTGVYERGRGRADHQPEHGHPGREQLRAPAVRSLRSRRRGDRPADGRFPGRGGASPCRPRRSAARASCSTPCGSRKTRSPQTMAEVLAHLTGAADRPAHGRRRRRRAPAAGSIRRSR